MKKIINIILKKFFPFHILKIRFLKFKILKKIFCIKNFFCINFFFFFLSFFFIRLEVGKLQEELKSLNLHYTSKCEDYKMLEERLNRSKTEQNEHMTTLLAR